MGDSGTPPRIVHRFGSVWQGIGSRRRVSAVVSAVVSVAAADAVPSADREPVREPRHQAGDPGRDRDEDETLERNGLVGLGPRDLIRTYAASMSLIRPLSGLGRRGDFSARDQLVERALATRLPPVVAVLEGDDRRLLAGVDAVL